MYFSHFRNIIEVNFLSYVDVVNQALPFLEESNGSIGVISSIAGWVVAYIYA